MSDLSRIGVKAEGRFVFTCASCGGVAATLAVTDEGEPVDGGPMPDGSRLTRTPSAPAFRLRFLNITTGHAPDGLVDLVSGLDELDPLDVGRIDRELASFCCNICQVNYCSQCWSKQVVFDDGFFDCIEGRCPQGHEQTLDD